MGGESFKIYSINLLFLLSGFLKKGMKLDKMWHIPKAKKMKISTKHLTPNACGARRRWFASRHFYKTISSVHAKTQKYLESSSNQKKTSDLQGFCVQFYSVPFANNYEEHLIGTSCLLPLYFLDWCAKPVAGILIKTIRVIKHI